MTGFVKYVEDVAAHVEFHPSSENERECLYVGFHGDQVFLTASKDSTTVVPTTREKYEVFVDAMRKGEFDHLIKAAATTGRHADTLGPAD